MTPLNIRPRTRRGYSRDLCDAERKRDHKSAEQCQIDHRLGIFYILRWLLGYQRRALIRLRSSVGIGGHKNDNDDNDDNSKTMRKMIVVEGPPSQPNLNRLALPTALRSQSSLDGRHWKAASFMWISRMQGGSTIYAVSYSLALSGRWRWRWLVVPGASRRFPQ